MKVLIARDEGNRIRYKIHLDEDKMIPDPRWVFEAEWAGQPPPNVTREDYLTQIAAEVRGLAEAELQRRLARLGQAGEPLTAEGQTL